MTAEELREILRKLHLAQIEFALLLGAAPRAGQYWCAGRPISGPVATMARLLDRRPELVEVVREIASEPKAGRKK